MCPYGLMTESIRSATGGLRTHLRGRTNRSLMRFFGIPHGLGLATTGNLRRKPVAAESPLMSREAFLRWHPTKVGAATVVLPLCAEPTRHSRTSVRWPPRKSAPCVLLCPVDSASHYLRTRRSGVRISPGAPVHQQLTRPSRLTVIPLLPFCYRRATPPASP